jgi:hypothetical protein
VSLWNKQSSELPLEVSNFYSRILQIYITTAKVGRTYHTARKYIIVSLTIFLTIFFGNSLTQTNAKSMDD